MNGTFMAKIAMKVPFMTSAAGVAASVGSEGLLAYSQGREGGLHGPEAGTERPQVED
jgi:hypothetical protein